MDIGSWSPAPREGQGGASGPEEMLVAFDRSRPVRLLVCPALFDEANKLRRFTLAVMRALDNAGIDSALPDLPGMNESLALLDAQTLAAWRADADAAARHFGATHVLSIRAGALYAPGDLPGWCYAPVGGARVLAGMLRAEVIVAREAGRNTTREALLDEGRQAGLMLGGWQLGAALIRELETAEPPTLDAREEIDQSSLGGAGLWLRAEPGESAAQSEAIAAIIVEALAGESAGTGEGEA
jgi:hypothetical protein